MIAKLTLQKPLQHHPWDQWSLQSPLLQFPRWGDVKMVKQKTKKFKGILFGKFNLVCEFFPRRQAFDQYSIAFKTMFSPLHDTSNLIVPTM